MITPKFDWDMEDTDGEFGVIDLDSLDARDAVKAFIALSDLSVGKVPEEGDGWQDKFDKDGVYPPIIVECINPDGRFAIIQGNHRVIMWRKWGFTHAPAFVTHAEWLPTSIEPIL